MELQIQGHMFQPVNYSDKVFEITIVDWDDIKKIRHVVDKYNKAIVPYRMEDSGIVDQHKIMIIKIMTQKLISKIGPKMLKAGKEKWLNQKFTVRLQVRSYSFLSNHTENMDERVEGINFILKSIDLVI